MQVRRAGGVAAVADVADERAGLDPSDLDAVAYSYDPELAPATNGDITADAWDGLRTLYARRAPPFVVLRARRVGPRSGVSPRGGVGIGGGAPRVLAPPAVTTFPQ